MKHLDDILKESLLDNENELSNNSDNAVKISMLWKDMYFMKTVEELYKKYTKSLSLKKIEIREYAQTEYQIRKYDPSKHYFIIVKPRRGRNETYCIICNNKDGIAVGLDNMHGRVRYRGWMKTEEGVLVDKSASFEESISAYDHRPFKVCEVLPEDEWLYDYITTIKK